VRQREIPIEEWGPLTGASPEHHGSGHIVGTVIDARTGDPLPAVTVVATSTALQATHTAITDDRGSYEIDDVEPATYKVTFYYTDFTLEMSAIVAKDARATVNCEIDQSAAGSGTPIHVQGSKTTIVPLSTKP
jgi:hypothetical protein